MTTITALRTSPAGKRMVISHWSLVKRLRKVLGHWSLVISKEVEKRDREGKRETVLRKLVWLFVIWNLGFGIFLI